MLLSTALATTGIIMRLFRAHFSHSSPLQFLSYVSSLLCYPLGWFNATQGSQLRGFLSEIQTEYGAFLTLHPLNLVESRQPTVSERTSVLIVPSVDSAPAASRKASLGSYDPYPSDDDEIPLEDLDVDIQARDLRDIPGTDDVLLAPGVPVTEVASN